MRAALRCVRAFAESDMTIGIVACASLCGVGALGNAAEIAERESTADANSHDMSGDAPVVNNQQVRKLRSDGYIVIDNVLSPRIIAAAKRDAASAQFERTEQHSSDVRTDRLVWLREDAEISESIGDQRATPPMSDTGGYLEPGVGMLIALRRLRSVAFCLENAVDDEADIGQGHVKGWAGFDEPRRCHREGDQAHQVSAFASTQARRRPPLGVPRAVQLAIYPPMQQQPGRKATSSTGGSCQNDDGVDVDEEAVKAGGARYRAHRDNKENTSYNPLRLFTDSGINCREVSAILYLSDDGRGPSAEHVDESPSANASHRGGELVLYLGAHPTDVDGSTADRVLTIRPIAGRLILFDARSVLHEVLPHSWDGPRMALTSWIGGRYGTHDGAWGWFRRRGLTNS